MDLFQPMYWKIHAILLLLILTEIINDSFQTPNFPNELKLAEVTPVHKKKDPLKKEDYRPVRVLLHVSKKF